MGEEAYQRNTFINDTVVESVVVAYRKRFQVR